MKLFMVSPAIGLAAIKACLAIGAFFLGLKSSNRESIASWQSFASPLVVAGIELLKTSLTLGPARCSRSALFCVGSLIPEAVTYS